MPASPLLPPLPLLPMPRIPVSGRLRLTHFVASAVWWLALGLFALLFLTWGVLHGWIVPRIGEFRPQLEIRLTQALGVPVKIGSITAESGTLVPLFKINDVRLLDSAGRDALRLQQVTAAMSVRSLLSLGFEQLVIEQPQLEIARTADGRVFVAGLDVSGTQSGGDGRIADWLFSQREVVVRGGSLRWVDAVRAAPPLALNNVDIVLRNPGRSHSIVVQATPMPDWGDRFRVQGNLRSPLLSMRAGRWQDWSGEIFSDFPRLDLARIGSYADLGIQVGRGNGAVRSWATVVNGQITGLTADMALAEVDVRLSADLQSIAMQGVQGRISGQKQDGTLRFATQGLQFRTSDGIVWPGGNVSFTQTENNKSQAIGGEIQADRLNLAAVAQIADRLPLGTSTHALLRSLAPKGLLENIEAKWQGPASAPTRYEAKGAVQGLEVAALAGVRPGASGVSAKFGFNELGGKATLRITQGALNLPNAFEEAVVPVDELAASAQWSISGQRIELAVDGITFANPDMQGTAQLRWHTADPASSKSQSRFPGVLDLQGSLSRGDGARVHRYLPLAIVKPARDYVRAAITQGNVTSAKFKVKGDLFELPFSDPKAGEFRIAAQVKNVNFAYVPASIAASDSLPWPALAQLQGELVFDRVSLSVNDASGRFAGSSNLQFAKADARIADLTRSVTLVVSANARGPAAEVLGLVNSSPLAEVTNRVLAKASATGQADVRLRLNLPVFNLPRSKVAGTLTLANNDVQITPDTPLLARAKGTVVFSELGFALKDVQARMLGGDMRLEGGTRNAAGTPAGAGVGAGGAAEVTLAAAAANQTSVAFRAQGTITAEGLRQAKDMGFAARLAQNASGSTAYSATLGFRRGVPELMVSTNLQGMALNLPPPLNKTAESILPLRLENTLVRESLAPGLKLQDQLSVDVGRIASIVYVRDVSGAEPRVLRGGIGVGLVAGESVPSNEEGVVANINFSKVDVDAWEKLLVSATGATLAAGPALAGLPNTPTPSVAPRTPAVSAGLGYLPSVIAVRAQELLIEGQVLHNVVVGGSRDGLTWRANLDARELSGYVEYRQASGAGAGRVFGRLTRLSIGQAVASEIETTLGEQPTNIPALDIVVEDLELRGKKLGRVEVEATNRGGAASGQNAGVREWRLNKFNIQMPEALFTATGNWAAINAQAVSPTATRAQRNQADRRRTVMNFKLEIADSGELLKRFGMDKVLAKGKGKMEGQVAWIGSPLALDYPSMSGAFNVNVESGRFLKADPGIAKLLGVLSLQSLPRRLALDFRDVFTEGFSFDFIRGDVKIDQGVANTNNLQMKGVNAAVLIEGRADIAKETQDMRVVVVPEINAGTASLIAGVINPAIGIGTFLAQVFLRKPLIQAATQEFHIDGSWLDPKITKVERKLAPVESKKTDSQETSP